VNHAECREAVLVHMRRFPDRKFTAFEIGRVLRVTPGTVRNALESLLADGVVHQPLHTEQMIQWELDKCKVTL
jgi:predicted ArsR family transcriptional regulator